MSIRKSITHEDAGEVQVDLWIDGENLSACVSADNAVINKIPVHFSYWVKSPLESETRCWNYVSISVTRNDKQFTYDDATTNQRQKVIGICESILRDLLTPDIIRQVKADDLLRAMSKAGEEIGKKEQEIRELHFLIIEKQQALKDLL